VRIAECRNKYDKMNMPFFWSAILMCLKIFNKVVVVISELKPTRFAFLLCRIILN